MYGQDLNGDDSYVANEGRNKQPTKAHYFVWVSFWKNDISNISQWKVKENILSTQTPGNSDW